MIDLLMAEGLTRKQAEVVDLVLTGASNNEIALYLHISEKTIKFHLTKVFQKLGLKSRSELMARYMITIHEHKIAMQSITG